MCGCWTSRPACDLFAPRSCHCSGSSPSPRPDRSRPSALSPTRPVTVLSKKVMGRHDSTYTCRKCPVAERTQSWFTSKQQTNLQLPTESSSLDSWCWLNKIRPRIKTWLSRFSYTRSNILGNCSHLEQTSATARYHFQSMVPLNKIQKAPQKILLLYNQAKFYFDPI